MAKDIYWHVRMKRLVVANFEIDRSMFKDAGSFVYIDDSEFCPETLERIARDYFRDHEFREGAISFYWDEAQIKLNSRDWRNNSGWIRFFTQHRKLGYDVFLVAQHHEMIDKQVRAVIEYEVMHRKANNVGLFGRFVSVLALGHPVVVCVRMWYGMKMKLSSEWMIGTRKYYRLYDTLKMFDGSQGVGQGGREKSSDKKIEKSEENITNSIDAVLEM